MALIIVLSLFFSGISAHKSHLATYADSPISSYICNSGDCA